MEPNGTWTGFVFYETVPVEGAHMKLTIDETVALLNREMCAWQDEMEDTRPAGGWLEEVARLRRICDQHSIRLMEIRENLEGFDAKEEAAA